METPKYTIEKALLCILLPRECIGYKKTIANIELVGLPQYDRVGALCKYDNCGIHFNEASVAICLLTSTFFASFSVFLVFFFFYAVAQA